MILFITFRSLTNMHIGHQTDIIILDFAKAFDKVNHNKLIYELKAHRVDVLTVEWIEAFLNSRSQVVVLDGTSSDSVPVTSGVPQGSVLGPALFLLYINDLPDTIDSQVRLFADDTVLYRTIKSDTDHHRLQADIDKLTEWAIAWDMQFHPDKCLVMNISKKRHPSKFTYSLPITDLKTTDTAKYLGITISQDMKWTTLLKPVHVPTEHLDSSKEMSKYDPLALRRSYTIALFARTSNMLRLYGPLVR